MPDLELYDLEMTRALIAGNTADATYDTSITEWAPVADRYVYDAIKKYAGVAVPFQTGNEAYVTANHKLAASAKLAELVSIERNKGKEKIDALRRTCEDSIAKIIEAYQGEPNERTSPSVAVSGSFATPFINEDDWNGINSDIGSPLGPTT